MEVPYGYIKDNLIFLSAWGEYPDRQIGEVKEDGEEAAVEYFKNKFADFKEKVDDLVKTIEEAENKGSYLMKLLHLKEQLGVHEGLGDYQELKEILEKYEALLTDIIQKNRERNTEIKNALMEEMREAVQILNWNEATEKVHDIKARWLKTGNPKEEVKEEMETSFWGMVQDFFDRKKAFFEDKQRLLDARKKKYEDLIDETNALQGLKGKERFDRVKELKAQWNQVGNIPAREYKRLFGKFNRALKGKKELPPPDFDGIEAELQKMYDKTIKVDKDLLQQYRKSLGGFKTQDSALKQRRHELMQLVNIIWERDFLEGLAGRKHKGFHLLEPEKQAQHMKKLLVEFLRRDKQDLGQYEENTQKFAGHDKKTQQMLERKLGQQRNKIEVKEKLLKILEEKVG